VRALGVSLAILALAGRTGASEAVAGADAGEKEVSPVPAGTLQIVLVRSASWNATTGVLRRFERTQGGAWQPQGEPASVNLGRHGMAWGRGLQATNGAGPVKKEGDERSPAGVFALGPAFGYTEALPDGAKRYPYVHITRAISCIEDKKSRFYNQVIDHATVVQADWSARDDMLRADGLFRWGVVVEHNTRDTVPGAGSCIFLHIWRGPGKGTAGCTAMPTVAVEETIRWLDPSHRPVLVQLPESEYTRLRASWELP
jgi:L,D-peptidoglycan transpeptidase YkuD (ErfK/YbiS/YcfS/YnhG family)